MKKKLILLVFALLAVSMISIFVMADDNATTNSTNDNRQINATRCQAINNRIDGRIKQFEEGRDKHLISFDNLVNRWTKQIEKIEERGFNATGLRDKLLTLESMINVTRADYALFIQKLAETRNFTCGHSEGQFKTALNAAKAQLKIVRDDIEKIKEFTKTELKNDVKQLRREIKEQVKEKIENKTEKLEKRIEKIENKTEKLRERLEIAKEKLRNRGTKA